MPIFSSRHSMVTTASFRKPDSLVHWAQQIICSQISSHACQLQDWKGIRQMGPHCDSHARPQDICQGSDTKGWAAPGQRHGWGCSEESRQGLGTSRVRHTPLLPELPHHHDSPAGSQELEPTWGPHPQSSPEGAKLPSPSPTAARGYKDTQRAQRSESIDVVSPAHSYPCPNYVSNNILSLPLSATASNTALLMESSHI